MTIEPISVSKPSPAGGSGSGDDANGNGAGEPFAPVRRPPLVVEGGVARPTQFHSFKPHRPPPPVLIARSLAWTIAALRFLIGAFRDGLLGRSSRLSQATRAREIIER